MEIDNTFIAVDVETTGFYNRDQIIEIAAVKFSPSEEIETFSSLVFTDRKIPSSSRKVHGISNSMLDGQPLINDVLKRFKNFIGSQTLIAHNASFDRRFINNACENSDIKIDNEWFDTMQLARKKIPKDKVENHKLPTLAKYFKLNGRFHRALEDARITSKIYLKLHDSDFERSNIAMKNRKQKTLKSGNLNIKRNTTEKKNYVSRLCTREVTLRHGWGHSVPEIAEALDQPIATIKKILKEKGLLVSRL